MKRKSKKIYNSFASLEDTWLPQDEYEETMPPDDPHESLNFDLTASHTHLVLQDEIKDHQNYRQRQLNFATISHSELRFSNFFRTNLSSSLFLNTDFYSSHFELSNLDFSEIVNCGMVSCNLSGASLQSTLLRNVDFSWCDLRGADFFDSRIENCLFEGALFDKTTILSEDIRQLQATMKKIS